MPRSSQELTAASTTVGAYTKLRKLGQGRFGHVWLVRHTTKGGEALVLKEVSTALLTRAERKALGLEIDVLRRARHPGIIAYVDHIVAGAEHDTGCWKNGAGRYQLNPYNVKG